MSGHVGTAMPPIETGPWLARARSKGRDVTHHENRRLVLTCLCISPDTQEFFSSPLCCSLLVSSLSFLVVSALDTADITFRACSVFVVIVSDLVQVISARVAFGAFPAPLLANVKPRRPWTEAAVDKDSDGRGLGLPENDGR